MGDAAEDATESGLEMWILHEQGRCGEVGPCPYCEAQEPDEEEHA